MTKKSDAAANAAHFAAEDAARAEVIADRLFDLGVPLDPLGAAAWHERAAGRARLDAAKQGMARLAEARAEDEQAEIAARIAEQHREDARMADIRAELDRAGELVAQLDRRDENDQLQRELTETAKRLADSVDVALRTIRYRVATQLPITVGQAKLLDQYGGVR